MVSAQMSGNGTIATAAADKLARVIEADAVRTIPWVQPIKVAPYFAHAQFSPPRVTLAIADPGDDLPFVKAMWHYARAVALAAQKSVAGARAEADAIARLKGSNFGDLALAIPLQPILDIALHVAQARIALANDKLAEARAEFERAAAIQDALPYGEPPHWYFSVYNSLGAVLVRLGELEAAEKAFKNSLVIAPNNGWAFYGLTEVYRRTGQKAARVAAQTQLARSWTGDRRMLNLTRL
jgi:tetratricopeptide (TPR) repeat protein